MHFVVVNLELQLVLDVHPEHLEKILRILFLIKIAVLIQIGILHQGLASMDLGFVVLAFHEDSEEAPGGLKAKDPCEIALGVIDFAILLLAIHLENRVVGVNDLRNCHAEIPDNLGGAILLSLELCDDHVDNLLDIRSYGV